MKIMSYNYFGSGAFFWSSTGYSSSLAYYLIVGSSRADMNYSSKALGYSVRCLKDLN